MEVGPNGVHEQGILHSYKEGLGIPLRTIEMFPCTNKMLSIYLLIQLSNDSSPPSFTTGALGGGGRKTRGKLTSAAKSEHKPSQTEEAN